MKAVELEKNYPPQSFEDKLYENWEKTGQFLPRYNAEGTGVSFTGLHIVCPATF